MTAGPVRFTGNLRSLLSFLRDPQRYLAAGATVLFGMLAIILAQGFIDRNFLLFREGLIRGHVAHVQVLPGQERDLIEEGAGGESAGELAAGSARESVRESVGKILSSTPGAVVTERLSFAGLVSLGDRTIGFLGEGVQPEREQTLSRAVVVDAGRAVAGDDSSEVMLGEGLARSLGAGVGDSITLLVTTPAGSINAVELAVVGVFHSATKAYDDRALRIPLDTARRLMRVTGASRLMILLPDTAQADAAAAALKAGLAGRDLEVKVWHELADFYTKTVDLFSRQLNFVKAIIIAIVMLGVFNSTARNVLERTREIGTMMALGNRSTAIARRFVAESLLIGLLAGLAGVVLAALLAWLITWIGIPMPAPPGNAHGFTGGVSFSLAGSLEALAWVVAVCVLAALLPAWRITRIDVVDALRAA